MNRENKTRPSVGALGRAVETGSAMQADTTSKPQFTPNGPGGQRKVADLLSHGRENAIPATEHERAACVRHRAAEAIDRAGV